MPHTLRGIEAMIATAEAALARLAAGNGLAHDPADPSDPLGCLELWLAVLRAERDRLAIGDAAARSCVGWRH